MDPNCEIVYVIMMTLIMEWNISFQNGRQCSNISLSLYCTFSTLLQMRTHFSLFGLGDVSTVSLYICVSLHVKKNTVKYGHPICPPTTVKSTVNPL